VTALWEQTTNTVHKRWYVTATADYFATLPSTWRVDMPNLSAAGAPTIINMTTNANTSRDVEAYAGHLADYIGAQPQDGAVIVFGGHAELGPSLSGVVRLDEGTGAAGGATSSVRARRFLPRPTFGRK